MFATTGVPAMKHGVMARVRRASQGRYTLMLSWPSMPGRGRVFFAYSLRHLAELLKLHVPGWATPARAGGMNRVAAA